MAPSTCIHYYPRPAGIDQYWTTPLEIYCYLYHSPNERARLQNEANKLATFLQRHPTRHYDASLFHITHPCGTRQLLIRAGEPDETFLKHLQYLLRQEGIHLTGSEKQGYVT